MKNQTFSITALSDLTGLDRRRIKRDLGDLVPVAKDAGANVFELGPALKRLFTAADARRDEGPSLKTERLRLLRAKREREEFELCKAQRDWINVETVFQIWGNHIFAAKRIILSSNLSTDEKAKILQELQEIEKRAYLEDQEVGNRAEPNARRTTEAPGEARPEHTQPTQELK